MNYTTKTYTDYPLTLLLRSTVSENGCICYPTSRVDGYANVRFKGAFWRVHRLSWTFAHGPIPSEIEVDHICRTRNCFRPDHLQLATRQENMARVVRSESTACRRGHEYVEGSWRWQKNRGYLVRRCRTCERMR